MIQDNHHLFVKPNNPQLKVKLDGQLQLFLAEQSVRFPDLGLQKYSTTFYTTEEQNQKEEVIKQIALGKEKA